MITDSSKVAIHYKLTVNGQEVDSSEGKEPLTYVHGKGQIIPGLEKELEGMKPGDKKQVEVSPQDGYGEVDKDNVQAFPKEAFAEPEKLEEGMTVSGKDEKGADFHAQVAKVDDEQVTLDFNHPLAGQTLKFEVEVVSVD